MTARARRTVRRPEVEGLERREAPSGSGLIAVNCDHLVARATGGPPAGPAAEMHLLPSYQKVREA